MGTSSSSSRNTAAQNAAVASLLSGAGTGGINAVRRSANPVNVVGYRPPPVGSSTHGMIVNSPGNYPPTSFQSLQNAAGPLAAIYEAQRERDARAAKTSVAPAYQPGMRGRGQPVAPLDSGNAWSPELLEAVMATPVPTPYWQKSLSTLADMAYRGFMAPSRAMNGYYDQFVVDPETGRVISMSDPRMIDDAAALAGFAQTGGIPLVGSRVAAAAIPRATAAAALPRATAAGIDAALTPRQAQFRELMDNLNAGERAAVAAPTPAVSPGPRIPQGGGQPAPAMSLADSDILESIVGNLGTSAQREALRSTSGVYDDMLKDAVANAFTSPPSVARLSPDDLDALLYRAVEKGFDAPGPLSAEAGAAAYRNARQKFVNDELSSLQGSQLFSDVPPMATTPAATGRNAFSDIIDAMEAAKAAKVGNAEKAGPYVAVSADEAANIIRRPGAQTVYPPGFMSADEAANVLRPGPRVAADAGRMDPITKRLLIAAGGAGVALPGLAGLSLLANGQLGPAPTATTPQPVAVPDEQRGIGPSAALDQIVKTPTGADITRADRASMRQGNEASQLAAKAVAEKRDAEWSALPVAPAAPGVKFGDVKVRNGVRVKRNEFGAIVPVVAPDERLVTEDIALPGIPEAVTPIPAWSLSPPVHIPGGWGNATTYVPEIDNLPIDSDAPITAEAQAQGGGRGAPASGEPSEDTAPVAGEKFTPGPGQFVGTNGYIYEQSSDGSFERVGKVPGYTPAQLSEAENKGAFRDPNNIVTGGAKPRKQVKKKGEKNFIDKAGDILKERFDDSLFARLFLNQDDEAAPEAAATGPEAVEYYSTPPSSVPESLVSSSGSSKKRKKKDEDETDGGTGGTGTGGTGTGGTGTGTYTPPTQAMIDALYAPYMRQYTGPGAGYVPGVNPEWRYFTPAFADGGLVDGRLVLGDGGPKEDKIPATIDGVEQAKLSNGEFVMTAAAVKNAGGGDIELGAKRLMDLNNMLSYGRPAERLKVQHVK